MAPGWATRTANSLSLVPKIRKRRVDVACLTRGSQDLSHAPLAQALLHLRGEDIPDRTAHAYGPSDVWFGSFRRRIMLYTIAVVLLILWLLGLVGGYTIGAFVHVLLVVAIVLFLVGVISGRRVA